ncbi:hypothetical protein NDU88_000075 [Pleurodeles waltl]|uniref:Uncharacterized protein n=1 Tax=Pleurodeles waltl TaxID=8319 RepID=A0AAV7TE03_PLEWA|nr:hypothetical protein NDU88_000075 [Pleurodeles waltl]
MGTPSWGFTAAPPLMRPIDTPSVAAQGDKLYAILTTITSIKERMEAKIDAVVMELSLLRDDHRKMNDQRHTLETAVVDQTSMAKEHSSTLHNMTDQILTLEASIEDQDGRAWRNKRWIIDHPEYTKGTSTVSFPED